MLLAGRHALITGASRGIGADLARTFAKQGARVTIHGRNRQALEQVAEAIAAEGADCSIVTGELTDEAQVEELCERVERECGTPDILVANAGGSYARPGLLECASLDEWRASIDNNLTATFLTLKAFLPGMKRAGRGSIITIASAAGRKVYAQAPVAYGTAKAAIIHLSQLAAAQAGPSGVRVNCIAPETILTEANEQRIPEDQKERMAKEHPLQRLGRTSDVSEAALFLASDMAPWITGVTLDVAGGAVLV